MFSARFLLGFFDSVYLFALVGWVGAILFFSFGVAPIIFKTLDAASAARFVRALFPRYYLWGAICAAAALPAMLGGPLSFPEFRGPMVAVRAFLIMGGALVMLYCGNSLTPAINAARDAGEAGKDRFDRLHRRSVRLNVVCLLIGSALIVQFATRRTPQTDGIVEKSPAERVEYEGRVMDEIERLLRRKPAAPPKDGSQLDEETRNELRDIVEAKRKRDDEKKAAKARRD